MTTLKEDQSYLLFLNSQDKISGSNNDATFYINWDTFLPRKPEQYEMSFMFNSGSGHFTDNGPNTHFYTSAKIKADFQGKNYTYDTATKSQSLVLGAIRRTIQSTYADFSCIMDYNPKKIIQNPNQQFLNIQILNPNSDKPLVDNRGTTSTAVGGTITNASGTTLLTLTTPDYNLQVGSIVTGTGIPTHTNVTYISPDAKTIQINKPTTASVTAINTPVWNCPLQFANAVTGITNNLGSATFTIASNTIHYFYIGQQIYGTGIPTGTTITNISTPGVITTITMSNATTASITSTGLTQIVDNTRYDFGTILLAGTNTSGTSVFTQTQQNNYMNVGQTVTGVGIQDGTTIVSNNATTITLSKPTTSAVTSIKIKISNPQPCDMTNWNMVMKFSPMKAEQ